MLTPNIDTGSQNLTPTINDIYGMVETIARQVIMGVKSTNPLAVFSKGTIDRGTIVQEVLVGLAEKYAFNKNAVDQLVASDPDLAIRYYDDWTTGQYETTVRDDEIRKVVIGSTSKEEIAERIVGSLTESDGHDQFVALKAVLKQFATDHSTSAGKPANTTELLTLVRNVIDTMTFTNNKYCPAGIETRTAIDDIYILMPFNVRNKIDVETLAQVFNLEKAEMISRIIPIDTTDSKVFIADKNAIFHYNRLKEMTSVYNAKARYMNYFYTTDDLYGYSPLFKMTWIDATSIVPAEEQA
ncbi:MAG: hypothetical protein II238_01275 [Alphaproteobacteria bacterium]|nr:hypothetical protein [Alphaproteobacteria bacterium]